MENNILIGLGGTGGRVVSAFRRRFFDHFGVADSPESLIEYIYADSKDSDCKEAQLRSSEQAHDSIWRVRGNSVALDARQVVSLKAHDFNGVLNNPSDFNRISSWLGDIETWQSIWRGSPNGVVAGGQMRRFGRYLLAANVAEFDKSFNEAVESVRRRGRSATDSHEVVKVHIFAGLAGGTGSGTFIDVICRIRALTYFSDAIKILLYVVPPQIEQTSWATHTYYANGYAALTELNAFLVGSLKPSDISGETSIIDCNKPIDNVFIITNRTINDNLVDVERVIPEVIAETVFQTIVLSGDAIDSDSDAEGANIISDARWRKALEGENVELTPETDYEALDGDPPPPAVRANRFLSFGLKRIAIPCDDIREHLNQVFIRSALMQMQYNHWVEQNGYVEGSAQSGVVKAPITRDQEVDWGLTEAQLRLDSRTFNHDSGEWKAAGQVFDTCIGEIVERFNAEHEQKGKNKKPLKLADAMTEIEEIGSNRFHQAYREDEGVIDYYRTRGKEVTGRARQIQANIEGYFYGRWVGGHMSLRYVSAEIEQVLTLIKKKIEKLEKEKNILELELTAVKTSQSASKAKIDKRTTGLAGLLAQAMPARSMRELENYGESTTQFYAKRTRLQANAYAGELAMSIQICLEHFQTVVQRLQITFSEAVELCDAQIGAINLFARENDGGYLERFFDAERTREVAYQLRVSRSDQERVAGDLRGYIRSSLESQGQGTFTKFAETFSAPKLVADLQKNAAEQVIISHDRIMEPHDKILDANILSRFYKEFSGQEEKLRLRMREWTKQAAVLTKFNSTERQRQGIAVKSQRSLVAFVPSAAKLSEDLQNVRTLIVQAISGEFSGVEIVETFNSPQELTILSMENMFPLRVLDFVDKLKTKYDAAVGGRNPKRSRMELHIEGDGLQFPPLAMPSAEELRNSALAYWLLAEALGLLEEYTSPTTGETQVRFKRILSDGRSDFVVVGDYLKNRVDSIKPRQSGLLKHLVLNEVAKLEHKKIRDAVKDNLLGVSEGSLKAAGGDHAAPIYQQIDNAVGDAIEILK